jgi:hypothetical protein
MSMRASHWLLGLATVGTVFGAVAAGCGGSSSSGGGSPDSSTSDVTAEKAPEAAAEAEAAVEAAPPCPIDGSITSFPVPDASLGDSGATTEGCVSCVTTSCPTVITACNANCACKEAFATFEQCVAAGGSIQTCAVALASDPDAGIGITQLGCAIPCASACGVTIPTGDGGGGEGGGGEGGGGEGGTDAGPG